MTAEKPEGDVALLIGRLDDAATEELHGHAAVKLSLLIGEAMAALESQATRIAELTEALEIERVKTRHWRRDGNYETCPQCRLVKPWHEEYCPTLSAGQGEAK